MISGTPSGLLRGDETSLLVILLLGTCLFLFFIFFPSQIGCFAVGFSPWSCEVTMFSGGSVAQWEYTINAKPAGCRGRA